MYKSEIRPSQIKKLFEKCQKLNYQKYLCKVGLMKCRAFNNQKITANCKCKLDTRTVKIS